MPKAELTIEIGCPPEAFYEVITDFDRYPEFLSALSSARVLSRDGERYRFEQEVNLIKRFKMVLDLEGDPGKRLDWTLVQCPLLKKNDGGWELRPSASGGTEARYHLDIEVGMMVPKGVAKKLVENDMSRMLKAFKKRAETLHG